jgi:hypothetical protein
LATPLLRQKWQASHWLDTDAAFGAEEDKLGELEA